MGNIQIDFRALQATADQYSKKYATAIPFPHLYLDNVFPEDVLNKVLEEFPSPGQIEWGQFDTRNEKKLASRDELQMGPTTREFIHILNSKPFLKYLETISGIQNLIPDPDLEGGGLHQIIRGGLLKVHADFNKHSRTDLDRRLNVLIYLNKDWKEEYGGQFELWNKDMSRSEVKILPLFNRMAIFSTTSTSYHGHPDALNCPEDRSRKSIAMYYYTNGRPECEVLKGMERHTTLFVNRKGKDETLNIYRKPVPILEFLKKFVPPILLEIKRKFIK